MIPRIVVAIAALALTLQCSSAWTDCRFVERFQALDTEAFDFFGGRVAIAGDIVVVGAMNQRNSGDNRGYGAAYIFEIDGVSWNQIAKLTPSDASVDQEFGVDVGVNDSGDTIVVGAGQDNGSRGAAYVFVRPSTGWTNMNETAKLTASDGEGSDVFGGAVSTDGRTVAVGAINDQDLGRETGAVYVFERSGDEWSDATETFKLLPSAAAQGTRVGRDVVVLDGLLVAGADEIANGGAGFSVVYERDRSTWIEVATLTPSDGAVGDRFGLNLDTNGRSVVVGAFDADHGETDAGAAYVFKRPNDGWADMTETAKLSPSDPVDRGNFGIGVAIDRDNRIVVGAYGRDNLAVNPGTAYLFEPPLGAWRDSTEDCRLAAEDGMPGDAFGVSVAIDGPRLIVGAHRDEDRAGSLHVYDCPIFELRFKSTGSESVTLVMTNPRPVKAGEFAFDYDPSVVTTLQLRAGRDFPPSTDSRLILDLDPRSFCPERDPPRAQASAVWLVSEAEDISIPPGKHELLEIVLTTTSQGAADCARLRFIECVGPAQAPIRNIVSDLFGTSWPARTVDSSCIADALFRRGDPNSDGVSDVSDVVFTLNWLFLGGEIPSCLDSADSNDDGVIDVSDAAYLLTWRFVGGEPPDDPLTYCGHDPTEDELRCVVVPACE
jgi:hypothetical protein